MVFSKRQDWMNALRYYDWFMKEYPIDFNNKNFGKLYKFS